MRCVLITPLGAPVDPEVNSTLATVSGPTRACAASTCEVAGVSSRAAKAVALDAHGPAVDVTTSTADTAIGRSQTIIHETDEIP
jgi:hypothetical protein